MTRLILAIAVFVSFASAAPASAQALGVRGGLNMFTIAVTPEEDLGLDTSAKAGLVGGAFLTFYEQSRLSFEVAGQFALRRVAFGPDIVDTISYVEAPVVARYSLFKSDTLHVRGLAGGVAGFRLQAREKVGDESYSATDAFKPVDFGVVFGAQADLNRKWSVEGRYQLGLTEVFEVTAGGLKSRQRGFQVLVGYRLR